MKKLIARGFTLLEVMIATAVFAICISTVYGLYTSIVSVVANVEERLQLNDRVQVAFARINRDLQGLHRGDQGYLTGRDSSDQSEDEPILEFISSAHLFFDPDTVPVPLSRIRYYLVQSEEDETYYLLRSDTPVTVAEELEETAEGRKFRICEGLREARLRYRDRDGDEQDDWDTTEGSDEEQQEDARFPNLVAIELVFPSTNDEDEEGPFYSTAVQLRPALIKLAGGTGG